MSAEWAAPVSRVLALSDPTPPIDPESLDATRPADLNACIRCGGTGGITVEWQHDVGRPIFDECPDCLGSGER